MIGVLVSSSRALGSDPMDERYLQWLQRTALRELEKWQRAEAMKISAELRERGQLN
jgi:hypothetical protein